MKLLIVLLSIFLVACSNKYVGEKNDLYQQVSCPIERGICELSYSQLAVRYSLVNKGDMKYLLEGTAIWDNSKKSAAFEKVQKIRLVFIFLKENTVVHQESVLVRGDQGKNMPFSTEFETPKTFGASLLAEFSGRVTE